MFRVSVYKSWLTCCLMPQGPHSFSLFELKTFLKTFSTTLTTYCKKIAIFLRRLKDSLMFIMQAI